jgi:hypothetical protein
LETQPEKEKEVDVAIRPLRESCSPDTIYSDNPCTDYNINHWMDIKNLREKKLA